MLFLRPYCLYWIVFKCIQVISRSISICIIEIELEFCYYLINDIIFFLIDDHAFHYDTLYILNPVTCILLCTQLFSVSSHQFFIEKSMYDYEGEKMRRFQSIYNLETTWSKMQLRAGIVTAISFGILSDRSAHESFVDDFQFLTDLWRPTRRSLHGCQRSTYPFVTINSDSTCEHTRALHTSAIACERTPVMTRRRYHHSSRYIIL